jgi:hypothetical protein
MKKKIETKDLIICTLHVVLLQQMERRLMGWARRARLRKIKCAENKRNSHAKISPGKA